MIWRTSSFVAVCLGATGVTCSALDDIRRSEIEMPGKFVPEWITALSSCKVGSSPGMSRLEMAGKKSYLIVN